MPKPTPTPFRLSPAGDKILAALMHGGRFKSRAEAVECALTLLNEKLTVDAVPASSLRAAVRQGLASIRRGEWHEADDVIAEIHALDRASRAQHERIQQRECCA